MYELVFLEKVWRTLLTALRINLVWRSHDHSPTFMRSHLSSWKDKLRRKSSQCKPTEEQIAASMALKELGNEHFKAGRYKEAEELYSEAYAL
jgi:hypothetical protein